MVEISKRKEARPKRIIGFVESELEPSGGQRLHGKKRNRRRAGIKTEPRGAAEARFSPRRGGHGIAAHVVAFGLIGAIELIEGVRRTLSRSWSIIAQKTGNCRESVARRTQSPRG